MLPDSLPFGEEDGVHSEAVKERQIAVTSPNEATLATYLDEEEDDEDQVNLMDLAFPEYSNEDDFDNEYEDDESSEASRASMEDVDLRNHLGLVPPSPSARDVQLMLDNADRKRAQIMSPQSSPNKKIATITISPKNQSAGSQVRRKLSKRHKSKKKSKNKANTADGVMKLGGKPEEMKFFQDVDIRPKSRRKHLAIKKLSPDALEVIRKTSSFNSKSGRSSASSTRVFQRPPSIHEKENQENSTSADTTITPPLDWNSVDAFRKLGQAIVDGTIYESEPDEYEDYYYEDPYETLQNIEGASEVEIVFFKDEIHDLEDQNHMLTPDEQRARKAAASGEGSKRRKKRLCYIAILILIAVISGVAVLLVGGGDGTDDKNSSSSDKSTIVGGNSESPPTAVLPDSAPTFTPTSSPSITAGASPVATNPTTSLTPQPTPAPKCFESRQELDEAVQAYLNFPSPANEVSQTYGYPIGSWCVGQVTDFTRLFSSLHHGSALRTFYEYFDEPLSGWDMSGATSLNSMFLGALSFNQDISMWNTQNVQDFSYTFKGAQRFNQDISSWDTSSATSMLQTFQGASRFNQPIGYWTVDSVRDMSYMFSYCQRFNADLSGWNMQSVTDTTGMFSNAAGFNGDVTTWNTANVIRMDLMFQNARFFNQDISGWDLSNVQEMGGVLVGASAFNQNLCPWRNTLGPFDANLFKSSHGATPATNPLFGNSECPVFTSPVYDAATSSWTGPFCQEC